VDVSDPAMAQADEVVDDECCPDTFVTGDGVERVRSSGEADCHRRDRAGRVRDDRSRCTRREEDQPVDAKLEQRVDCERFAFRDQLAGREERVIVGGERRCVDSVDHGGEERVVQVGHKDPDDLGSPPHERTGREIGPLPKLTRGCEHGRSLRVADVVGTAHDK
jgi:hypothetical protein